MMFLFTEETTLLRGEKKRAWERLLSSLGLVPGEQRDLTVLMWDEDVLAATASLCGNIIKYVAVSPAYQGEGLTATLITHLKSIAFGKGITHLFLYTKPGNADTFSSLFFYPVASTKDILLLESEKRGVEKFLSSLPVPRTEGLVGCCVMNCNPFTLGHRYLIETAAKECDFLYVFVLSEDKSLFPASDRLELVRAGTADLENVCVLPSGDYLISSATFPDYFLKDRDNVSCAHCMLDIEIFANYYAPRFNIKRRFVGTEPFSPLTKSYNEALIAELPKRGIEVREIPRTSVKGVPVSASAVRKLLRRGARDELAALVPASTLAYLEEHGMI